MSDPFVQLIDVTKRYGVRAVVAGVSLDVAQGEIVALLGPSGCGKTTTLRLIAGLETPDSGEIRIAGECAAVAGRNLIYPHLRRVGFVFQDLALWPHLTISGSLDFVLSSSGVRRAERPARIADMLRMVRIEPLAHRYPAGLSGGEQQRAALARALVAQPRLLLLDEPMTSLDTGLKIDLLAEFAVLQRSLKLTTIYVTHDQTETRTLSARVAKMRQGEIEKIQTAAIR